MSRIAFVIGVNEPKAPAPLQGAVSDAMKFAAWISRPEQGFETITYTDDNKKLVIFKNIFDDVERAVNSATYSQVVVYFAGHGFQSGGSEIWLLSGAPDNPSEAISVEASIMVARESGLKSVVFISDACRSIPARMQDSRVDGGSIFPNRGLTKRTRPEIDRLFATLPSLVAVEAAKANDDARRGGVFTRELMRGYLDTPAAYVDKVSEDGRDIEIVTNRKLKKLVSEMVEDTAAGVVPEAGQSPEFILESVEAYIGRVERKPKLVAGFPHDFSFRLPGGKTGDILADLGDEIFSLGREERKPPRKPTAPSVTAIAREAIDVASQGGGVQAAVDVARKAINGAAISDAIDRYSVSAPVDHFETQTGFAVTGAKVIRVASPQVPAEVLTPQLIRIHPAAIDVPAASLVIEFDSGTGTVLPALRGYVGHIFVDSGAVTNVNYVPSTNNPRWNEYQYVRQDVEALRAAVAAAASLGVFRIEPRDAGAFALRVRQLKVFDPALGLYAAYAYASAGIESEVDSVLGYLRGDLTAELFDVAMLARRDVRPREPGMSAFGELPIVPFCPMLRQGWPLLSARGAQLSDAARQAREWLLPALWTTFTQDGVKLLHKAVERGDF